MWIEADVICNPEVWKVNENKVSVEFLKDEKKRREILKHSALRWVNTESNRQIVLKQKKACAYSEWQVFLLRNADYALHFAHDFPKTEFVKNGICNENVYATPLKTFAFEDFYYALQYVIAIVGKHPAVTMKHYSMKLISNLSKVVIENYCPCPVTKNGFEVRDKLEVTEMEKFYDRLCDVLDLAGYDDEMEFFLNKKIQMLNEHGKNPISSSAKVRLKNLEDCNGITNNAIGNGINQTNFNISGESLSSNTNAKEIAQEELEKMLCSLDDSQRELFIGQIYGIIDVFKKIVGKKV